MSFITGCDNGENKKNLNLVSYAIFNFLFIHVYRNESDAKNENINNLYECFISLFSLFIGN